MKDIDRLLSDQRATPRRGLKQDFTKQIITAIETKPRKKRMPRWCKGLYMKVLALPKPAMIAVAAVTLSLVGTTAYAAYQWLAPKVNIQQVIPANDEGKREFVTNIENCGQHVNPRQHFELAQGSKITDEQLKKILDNTCEYQQVIKFAESRWQGDNSAEAIAKKSPGDWITDYSFFDMAEMNPEKWLLLGTVTNITDKSVTISATRYTKEAPGGPTQSIAGETVNREVPLAANVEAWQNGQKVPGASIKQGDVVSLVTMAQRRLTADKKSTNEEKPTQVAAIIKTTIDRQYVSIGYTGNPAIVSEVNTLDTCRNNAPLLCTTNNQYDRMIEVYTTARDSNQAQNFAQLRPDWQQLKWRTLDGRVTAIDGQTITLLARGSEKQAIVRLPYDAVAQYNQQPGSYKVAVGDLINLTYAQGDNEDHLQIKPTDVMSFTLKMRLSADKNTLLKY